jgi:hypothetical protein
MSWVITPTLTWNETVWNPSMISTALWLDAADASTVTTVSSAVSQWNDKSGNARNFAQSTSGNRPVLTANALGGKPVVTFDGTDDRLTASVTTGSSTATVVSVWKLNQQPTTANQSFSFGRIYDIKTGFGGLQLVNDFSTFAIHTKSSLYQTALTATKWFASGTSTELTVQKFDTSTTAFNRNGSVVSSTASPADVGEAGSNCAIGARGDVNSITHLNGYVAELIVVNGIASDVVVQKLEGYVAHKWGLTAILPAGHPYKTVGPTP